MRNRTLRRIGLIVTVAAIGAIGVVLPAMARRVGEHREQVSPERWAVRHVGAEQFAYFDGVEGRVTRAGDALVLRWGEQRVSIPVTGREVPGLPGLLRYSEWLAVLAMASTQGDVQELEAGLAAGEIRPRLVVVARSPAPERNPETWGVADTSDWRYHFWTLTPEGEIEPLDEPYAYTYYGEQIVEREHRSYKALKRMPSSSWQFVAAMQVTPGLHTPAAKSSSPISYPNYAGVRDDIDAMGWTWPAAGVAFLAFMVGVLTLAASFVRREDRWAEERARG